MPQQPHIAPALGRAADADARRRPRPIWEPEPETQQQQPDYANYKEPPTEKIWAPYGIEPVEPSVDLPPVAPFERDPEPPAERQKRTKAEARAAAKGGRHHTAAGPTPEARRRKPKQQATPSSATSLDPEDPPKRRLGRSLYDAVQTHGHFGMVDTGESSYGIRRIVCHVPKNSRGYILDIKPGEVIHCNSGRGRPIGGRLDVQYVTRHQYFAPGRQVTSCAIGVPEYQWQRFID